MSNLKSLPRSSPEQQGVSSVAVGNFVRAVEAANLELHSFMFVRYGHVVAEGWWSPYRSDRPHMLFSLSKSFVSTAIGLAVSEGRLTTEDSVASFFTEEAGPDGDNRLGGMRVKHLLTMTTGHSEDMLANLESRDNGGLVRKFFSLPIVYPPGTHFVYDSGASYMLSAILQKLTGQTLLDYLTPRILEPLGIEGAVWDSCPQGINWGGFGLSITTEDIAKFGMLYLNGGLWDGRQLIPSAWIKEAVSPHISTAHMDGIDKQQGYGYQFYLCRNGYTARGAYGQFSLVLPDQNAVIAITGGLTHMQLVLDLVWEHLLPAMKEGTLPSEPAAHSLLCSQLQSLALPTSPPGPLPPLVNEISGRRYRFEPNPDQLQSVSLEFDEQGCFLRISNSFGEHSIRLGHDQWVEGETALAGTQQLTAGRGVWQNEHTFVITLCFVETPFSKIIKIHWQDSGHLTCETFKNTDPFNEKPPVKAEYFE